MVLLPFHFVLSTAVDVVCAGTDVHGVAALESLVQCSGGCVSVVPEFDTEFQHDLLVSLTQQTARGPHTASSTTTAAADINSSNSGNSSSSSIAKPVRGCVIDVRTCTQGGVVLQHVVGPAAVTEEHDDIDAAVYSRSIAAAAAAAGSHSVSNSTTATATTVPDVDNLFRLQMGRQDSYSTLALYFSNPTTTVDNTIAVTAATTASAGASGNLKDHTSAVHRLEQQRYVHIQFVVRFMHSPGQYVTRVITHRYVHMRYKLHC
jgi:hypothetical protein